MIILILMSTKRKKKTPHIQAKHLRVEPRQADQPDKQTEVEPNQLEQQFVLVVLAAAVVIWRPILIGGQNLRDDRHHPNPMQRFRQNPIQSQSQSQSQNQNHSIHRFQKEVMQAKKKSGDEFDEKTDERVKHLKCCCD